MACSMIAGARLPVISGAGMRCCARIERRRKSKTSKRARVVPLGETPGDHCVDE
jgi:hypothetical protein